MGARELLNVIFDFLDNDDPLIESCPPDQTFTTEPGKPTRWIEWESPIATDNSGDSPTITCDPVSETNFTIGKTSVTCTALDAYGNNNSCTFYIDVIGMFSDLRVQDGPFSEEK